MVSQKLIAVYKQERKKIKSTPESAEIRRYVSAQTQKEFTFGSAITYIFLSVQISLLFVFMINTVFKTFHPVPPPQTFDEWLRENASKYQDVREEYVPGSGLSGALQSLFSTLLQLGLNIFADLLLFIRVESIQKTETYMQIAYLLLIDLSIILVLYVLLYRQKARVIDIFIAFVLSLLITYLSFALLVQGYLFEIFGSDIDTQLAGQVLGMNEWLFWDPRNLLAVPVMLTYIFGIDYIIFLYIALVVINVIFGIVLFFIENILHPVEYDRSFLYAMPSQKEFMKKMVFFIFISGLIASIVFMLFDILINLISSNLSGIAEFCTITIYFLLVYLLSRSILYKRMTKSEKGYLLKYYLKVMPSSARGLGAALFFTIMLSLYYTSILIAMPYYFKAVLYFATYFFSQLTGALAGYKQLRRRLSK